MTSTVFVISSVSSFDFSNFGKSVQDFTKYPSSVQIETLDIIENLR